VLVAFPEPPAIPEAAPSPPRICVLVPALELRAELLLAPPVALRPPLVLPADCLCVVPELREDVAPELAAYEDAGTPPLDWLIGAFAAGPLELVPPTVWDEDALVPPRVFSPRFELPEPAAELSSTRMVPPQPNSELQSSEQHNTLPLRVGFSLARGSRRERSCLSCTATGQQ
jgi:hypothetical protein